eukprot:364675-Chlamydomonas_euryale.AAC.4
MRAARFDSRSRSGSKIFHIRHGDRETCFVCTFCFSPPNGPHLGKRVILGNEITIMQRMAHGSNTLRLRMSDVDSFNPHDLRWHETAF